MVSLTFYGGVRSVTGSMHLVGIDGYRILLDCGLYQGRREDTYQRNLNFHFEPQTIDALIVSHAHIDHIGNIPNLVKHGFKEDIHSTPATSDLASVMLLDAAHIQEKDAYFVSKVRARHHEPAVEPLYHITDVEPALKLFIGHHYDRWFTLKNGVRVIFRDAGHILGSAIIILNINNNGKNLSLCYAVDLGKRNAPIIRDPFVVDDADVLIIESTYGGRLHGDTAKAEERLATVINETVSREGKIIVPSFALERTQELVYRLHQLKLQKRISDIPIFVDSPLAIDATDVFRMHPECFDEETNRLLHSVDDAFGFRRLQYVRSTEESMKLNDMEGPLMIISASGMAESGRILHHLKNTVGNPRNTVLIVGWQAENTLGWKLAQKWDVVRIFGEEYRRKCQVEVFDEFSAHADRNELIDWASKGRKRWRQVFVVHGEESASLSLAQALKDIGLPNVVVPELGETVNL